MGKIAKLAMQKSSVVGWLVTAYVVFMAIWLLLRLIFFDQLWPVALLNTIAQYLFVPLPVLLIVTFWQRDWTSLLKLSFPLILFTVLFGALFLPNYPNPIASKGKLITVMSFNVLFSNKSYQDIVNSIDVASPDIIGFQELRPANSEAIIGALEAEYPFYTNYGPYQDLPVGLLSRYPIEHINTFPLPPLDLALHTIINVDGNRIHVFVVHLSANQFFDNPVSQFIPLVIERYGRRAAEVTRLQEELSGLSEPILLMCDCNMTDTSEAYARLNTILIDSFREVGWGFGHTFHPPISPFPVQRIDYVWHSDEFEAIEAMVGQDGNSDHLPVVAKLRLIEAQ